MLINIVIFLFLVTVVGPVLDYRDIKLGLPSWNWSSPAVTVAFAAIYAFVFGHLFGWLLLSACWWAISDRVLVQNLARGKGWDADIACHRHRSRLWPRFWAYVGYLVIGCVVGVVLIMSPLDQAEALCVVLGWISIGSILFL